MIKKIRKDSQGESDHERQLDMRELEEKVHARNRQFWSKCFAEKLFVNGIFLQKGRGARIKRLENKTLLEGSI